MTGETGETGGDRGDRGEPGRPGRPGDPRMHSPSGLLKQQSGGNLHPGRITGLRMRTQNGDPTTHCKKFRHRDSNPDRNAPKTNALSIRPQGRVLPRGHLAGYVVRGFSLKSGGFGRVCCNSRVWGARCFEEKIVLAICHAIPVRLAVSCAKLGWWPGWQMQGLRVQGLRGSRA